MEFGGEPSEGAGYPDLVQLNSNRVVLEAVGRELLEQTVGDFLSVLATAMTVFEANGDYATGGRPHGWCRLMDELSRPRSGSSDPSVAIDEGRWSCRASCRRPATEAMQHGAPADYHCPGGLSVHAVPVRVGTEVIGSISVGLGNPPATPEALQSLAESLGVPVERLVSEARRARVHSPGEVAMARRAMEATARLVGEIVERRHAEKENERLRETYAGMIAHDLRSPINAILVSVENLLRPADLDEREHRSLERIRRGANGMSRMVEDLVDLARARVGEGIPLRRAPQNIAGLAAEVIEAACEAHPDQVLSLRTEGDTTLTCDGERLREVFENLIANGVRYGAGSAISMDIAGRSGEIVVTVRNGGPPIPPDVLPRIFDPFRRGSARGNEKRSAGLGLGLHIAGEFVRAHGGTIEAVSSAAHGTCVTIHLPR